MLCDACESAVATVFCAADEAALCRVCDDKVHMCNKLASRHVRVGLAAPSAVPRCDICENGPAFFYCEVDGSSLCLQCDMTAHVGGKRAHGRYLLLRQRVEVPSKKPGPGLLEEAGSQSINHSEVKREELQPPKFTQRESRENQETSSFPVLDSNTDADSKINNKMIDLNATPDWTHEQAINNQDRGVDDDSTSLAPTGIGSSKG